MGKILGGLISAIFLVGIAGILTTTNYPARLLDRFLYYYPCEQPITYKIGAVDPQFDLSLETAQKEVDMAAEAWNQVLGKKIFQNNEKRAILTVNFIYDQRQESSDKLTDLKEDLVLNKSTLERQIKNFQTKAANLEERVKQLNQTIANWNAQGGAPPGIYENLISQQSSLQREIDQLNAQAEKLNIAISQHNLKIDRFNRAVAEFNHLLTQKPEAGFFDGKSREISIYYARDPEELRHTLMHEFGHALNIDHVEENPKAIMYPLISQTTQFTPEDLEALNRACQKIPRYRFGKQK